MKHTTRRVYMHIKSVQVKKLNISFLKVDFIIIEANCVKEVIVVIL